MAEALSRQPRPRGPRLAIVTNASGPGLLARHALCASGGRPAALSPETAARLPVPWSEGEPVDVLGDAGPDRYAQALEAIAGEPGADGTLVVLAPQDRADPIRTAERLAEYARGAEGPVLASWMGGAAVAAGVDALNRAGVPTFDYPDTAARAFCLMWRYTEELRALYETPSLLEDGDPSGRDAGDRVVAAARAAGRTRLTPDEARALLGAYRIPSAGEARDGIELRLGSRVDPRFGPVIRFGAGGRLGEIYADHALALPPLNETLARRLMERTRIAAAVADATGLATLLVRFSRLVAEQRGVAAIELDPLLAGPDGIRASDARVDLHPAGAPAPPPLAIRPYPTEYVWPLTLPDGRTVSLRPIRPEDEPLMVAFHRTLSDRSVRLRYFAPLKLGQRVAHERLVRVCFGDYDRDLALVADHRGAEILGIGRLSKLPGRTEAEFAVLVHDACQRTGLGTELLRRLLDVARAEGLRRVTAEILPENFGMQRVCEKLGFRLERDLEESRVRAALDL
jgi:RimJ/RimL family protein N-acetyltransferase